MVDDLIQHACDVAISELVSERQKEKKTFFLLSFHSERVNKMQLWIRYHHHQLHQQFSTQKEFLPTFLSPHSFELSFIS